MCHVVVVVFVVFVIVTVLVVGILLFSCDVKQENELVQSNNDFYSLDNDVQSASKRHDLLSILSIYTFLQKFHKFLLQEVFSLRNSFILLI